MENPIKMDDLGVPPFLETSIWQVLSNYGHISWHDPHTHHPKVCEILILFPSPSGSSLNRKAIS